MQKREFLAQFQRPKGRSNSAARVPGADNRTEILSPANEQYKGRKSLAAVPKARRAVPEAGGRSK